MTVVNSVDEQLGINLRGKDIPLLFDSGANTAEKKCAQTNKMSSQAILKKPVVSGRKNVCAAAQTRNKMPP